MAVVVEMQNTGDSAVRTEVVASIEHVLADRSGDWRVSIVGSQEDDRWKIQITGPNAIERSYTLEEVSSVPAEHRAEVVRALIGKMLPAKP